MSCYSQKLYNVEELDSQDFIDFKQLSSVIPNFDFDVNYMDKKSNDRIAHDAHFYGAVWGIILTGFTHPDYLLTFFDKIL